MNDERESGSSEGSVASSRSIIFPALGILALLLLIFGFWLFRKPNDPVSGASRHGPSSPEVVNGPPSLGIDDAILLVGNAMWIQSSDEVKQYFLLREHQAEEVMQFLNELNLPAKEFIELRWIGEELGQGKVQEFVFLQWRDGGVVHRRIAPLILDTDENWKIDYEALACLSEPPWTEILSGKASMATARVVVSKDTYYNGTFQEAGWVCYRLTSLGSDELVYGYCRDGSPQHKAIQSMISRELSGIVIIEENEHPRRRAILEIHRPESARPNQFEIKRVLASDWVEEEVPFDERFGAGEPSGDVETGGQ